MWQIRNKSGLPARREYESGTCTRRKRGEGMSVKRHDLCDHDGIFMTEMDDGRYVLFEDYEKLESENQRMRKAIESFCDMHSFAVDSWKLSESIKPLFDIAKERPIGDESEVKK
jgi:hypothetical protein